MRQSQEPLKRNVDVVDLTQDSDSDDVGPRSPQLLSGQAVSRMAAVSSRRPNLAGVLDASLARENRLAQHVVPKPSLAVGSNEKARQRTTATATSLANGPMPTSTPNQQARLDEWLNGPLKSPVDGATPMQLSHSQDSENARSSGRKRKPNLKYLVEHPNGLSPTPKMPSGLPNGALERFNQSSNDSSARRLSELQGKINSARRQGSPAAVRLSSLQTPMRLSTGGRLKRGLTGDPGYLSGLRGQTEPPRPAKRILSPTEMIALLRNYMLEIAEDHNYFVTGMLLNDNVRSGKSATKCGRFYCAPTEHAEAESPIKDMKAIQFPSMPKGLYDGAKYGKLSAVIWKNHNSKAIEGKMTVPLTKHSSAALPVPKYSSYTSLRRNVLAEDDDKLRYFPYFGDDINDGGALQELYSDWTKNLPTVHRRSELAAMLTNIAEKFLEETGLSYYDALHYLIGDIETAFPLASSPEQRERTRREREQARRERKKAALYDDFEIDPAKQKLYLDSVPPPTPAGLAIAPAVCRAWKEVTTISLWDVIKNGKGGNSEKQGQNPPPLLDQDKASAYYSVGTIHSLKCLVCFTHECPAHHHVFGYLGVDAEENPIHPLIDNSTSPFRSDEACSNLCFLKGEVSLDPASKPWSTDQLELFKSSLKIWGNFERAGCLIALAIDRPCAEIHMKISGEKASSLEAASTTIRETSPIDSRTQPPPKEVATGEKRKRPARLLDRDDIGNTSLHAERTNFEPCNHVGSCNERRCDCVESEVVCEKTCRCPPDCPRRWRGCSCSKNGAKVCSSDKCECFKMNRECDPDLCGTCGAIEILDPVNRYDNEVCLRKCANVALQRDRPRRTLIGASKLAGYGLFMGEPAKAGEFLGEYKGELISNDEAERRGVVYDVRGFSYLFNVNEDHVIDANRGGNKFRFVNHSKLGENCCPRVVFANGVHRIGMYARRDLVAGEELYFNYNYGGKSLKFVQKEIDAPTAPQAIRPRTHKTGNAGRPGGKKSGKKGGPRPGAGRKPSNYKPPNGDIGDADGGGNIVPDLYEFNPNGAKSGPNLASSDGANTKPSQHDFDFPWRLSPTNTTSTLWRNAIRMLRKANNMNRHIFLLW
ncbi:MAG: hypothetical protein M1840_005935 [Geoglossum simile]|nr:MAG: hypothetical protein M1840_005935 [Geoglossum simile]